MTGAEQLKAALAKKQAPPPKRPTPIPETIVFASAGTFVAKDGNTYTITYEEE